jgi:hypothetical protein
MKEGRINILGSTAHVNLVNLRETFLVKESIFLVYECVHRTGNDRGQSLLGHRRRRSAYL